MRSSGHMSGQSLRALSGLGESRERCRRRRSRRRRGRAWLRGCVGRRPDRSRPAAAPNAWPRRRRDSVVKSRAAKSAAGLPARRACVASTKTGCRACQDATKTRRNVASGRGAALRARSMKPTTELRRWLFYLCRRGGFVGAGGVGFVRWRYESPWMSKVARFSVKRSTRGTRQAAPGKTSTQSLKDKFVVMTVETLSCRRLMICKSRSTARESMGWYPSSSQISKSTEV